MKAAAEPFGVMDASIAVAWCFEDERSPHLERLLDQMSSGMEAWVPAVWPFETANALLMAERHRRLTVSQASAFLSLLHSFNILIESVMPERIFNAVLSQARPHGLTTYDAAYLELALRRNLPLATLDHRLKAAAKKLGVRTL